ncbi:MAG: cytochrome c oxidase subunit II [Myxococcota bacterium]|nr:cytochrome c oxidase subunit II [Myxococcota bacterium]
MGSASFRIKGGLLSIGIAGITAFLSFLALSAVAAKAFAAEVIQTPTPFEPVSEPAHAIMDFGLLIIWICAAIFFIVFGLLIYTIIRYRAKAGDETTEPAQIYGSEQLELAWTITPVLIVIILGLITAGRIVALDKTDPPEGSLGIRVIGHQWWWELQYEGYDFITANELHIPVDQTAFLTLHSEDVIHSFWVPQLSGKTDLIPNRTNQMWMHPHETGLYVGQCAEYCGTQHAHMLLRVFVHTQPDFERWAAEQQQLATRVASVDLGRETFEQTACVNCHTVRGVTEIGQFGPDLTHLMSRTTIGAGAAANNRENLIAWITNPDHFKPGARMPAMKLSPQKIELVADYLTTLK